MPIQWIIEMESWGSLDGLYKNVVHLLKDAVMQVKMRVREVGGEGWIMRVRTNALPHAQV